MNQNYDTLPAADRRAITLGKVLAAAFREYYKSPRSAETLNLIGGILRMLPLKTYGGRTAFTYFAADGYPIDQREQIKEALDRGVWYRDRHYKFTFTAVGGIKIIKYRGATTRNPERTGVFVLTEDGQLDEIIL